MEIKNKGGSEDKNIEMFEDFFIKIQLMHSL